MRIAYGHQILSDDDPYVDIAKGSGHALSHCGPPGNTPVDLFPFRMCSPLYPNTAQLTHFVVQYFPSWFPGAFFAGRAREFKVAIRRMHDYPYDEVRKEMVSPSFLPQMFQCRLSTLKKGRGKSKTFLPFISPRTPSP